jgi:capsid protein
MGRIRDAWHALRGYAAAQDSRALSCAAFGSSTTSEVGAAAPTVARRARDAVRNDPYAPASSISGPATPSARASHPLAGQAAREAWRRWSDGTACDAEGRLDLYGLQALVMRAVVESGECFVRLLPADITPANRSACACRCGKRPPRHGAERLIEGPAHAAGHRPRRRR